MSEITPDVAEDYSQIVVDTPPSSADDSSKLAGQTIEQTEKSNGEEAATAPAVKVLFPRLGGNAAASASGNAVSWGSTLKSGSSVNSVSSLSHGKNGRASSPGSAKPLRSRNIQEVFSLDLDAQYQITKTEFSSIVQSVKQKYDVSVESTLSKTSRTFLISGSSDKIGLAKRELVKKLTKPVNVTFEVPSKTRSAIIGSGGKTIRAISDAAGVKIVVPKEVDEGTYDSDLEDYSVTISLHGDAESVLVAKSKILDVVKEETKNAKIVLPVEDSKLVPFIDLESVEIPADVKAQLFTNNDPAEIALNGPRDNVKLAKVKVINYLNELGLKIVVKKEKVPFKFHPLVKPSELNEKFHVEVQAPSISGDDQFVFIGSSDNVNEAIVYAKNSSKFHTVESLEISKAHGKNVKHAKNLILYFQKYNVLDQIAEDFPQVQVVLPKVESIPALESVSITLISNNDAADAIKTVRKQIVALVNELSPEQTLTISDLDYHLFHKDIKQILVSTESDVPFIQLGDCFPGNDDILLITKINEDDFKPSDDELKVKLESVNQQLEPIRKKQSLLASNVVSLAKKEQDELLGESKVTLNLINEAVSHAGAHALIKLSTPSVNQITIRGDDHGCKIASAAVKSIVENSSTESKITFQVPTNVVSRLIGPKGANLQQIREKFDVQTFIPQDSKDENTDVTLTGLQYNLDQAKTYILAEAKKWSDIITKELIVPMKYHRTLSGPQGTYRIRLENKYSVFIRFPKDSELVTIRGPSRGVKAAYDELKALLDFEIENGHKELLKVPVDYVTRVIGKSGETINDIKAEYGVELNFLDKTDSEKAKEAGEVELEITGSRSSIKEAANKVKSIIDQASNFETVTLEDIDSKYYSDIIGRSGSQLKEIISKAGGDEIRNKRVNIPDASSEDKVITIFGPSDFVKKVVKQIKGVVSGLENSITEELNIPQEKFGALIGPAGSVRRELETEFKVRIHVPNKNSSDEKVTVSGSPANIESCKKKIEKEIIRDSFDLEIAVPAKYHSYVSNSGLIFQTLRNEFSIDVSHGNLTRTAQSLSRANYKVPENVAGGENESSNVLIQSVTETEAKVDTIPWRLTYSPIDLSDVLGEDYKKDEESKDQVLEKASKLIEDRIAEAKLVNTEGFVWSKDAKKFNSIVGPNGRNIREIRNATKTVIHVPRKSDKVNNVIYVLGSEEGVKKAAELICKRLK